MGALFKTGPQPTYLLPQHISHLHWKIEAELGDGVRHETLVECLREISVDGKYIKIIRSLYWEQHPQCES